MIHSDVFVLTGYAFSLWALGFGFGLLITTVRKFAEKI